jgi:hypothetical protein
MKALVTGGAGYIGSHTTLADRWRWQSTNPNGYSS